MPSTPYLIGITVTNSAGNPVSSRSVTLQNESTSDELTDSTDSSGHVVFNCANFTNGWTDGDYLTYTASGSSTNGEDLIFKVVAHNDCVLRKFEVYYEV